MIVKNKFFICYLILIFSIFLAIIAFGVPVLLALYGGYENCSDLIRYALTSSTIVASLDIVFGVLVIIFYLLPVAPKQ